MTSINRQNGQISICQKYCSYSNIGYSIAHDFKTMANPQAPAGENICPYLIILNTVPGALKLRALTLLFSLNVTI